MPSSRNALSKLTSGEAGIVNHTDKVYLLDWMQLYKEEQKKRGKKNIGQIKSVTGILKEYAGERFTLNQIDLTFCHGYIDYMLTTTVPKENPSQLLRVIPITRFSTVR